MQAKVTTLMLSNNIAWAKFYDQTDLFSSGFQWVALVQRNQALLKGLRLQSSTSKIVSDKSTQLNAVEQVGTRLSDQKLA
jgi:hypothetical protein